MFARIVSAMRGIARKNYPQNSGGDNDAIGARNPDFIKGITAIARMCTAIHAELLEATMSEEISLFELHEKMISPLFPAFSSQDERFLALALCGEAGELANMIKKRWRDGVDLSEEIRDEIADIRIYLELIAKQFGIEGDKLDDRVNSKLQKVYEKWKHRLGPI